MNRSLLDVCNRWVRPRAALVSSVIVTAAVMVVAADPVPISGVPLHPGYGPPRQLARLANEEVSESSGLAVSHRQPGVFWTHNDSGDTARLFAFDATGRHLGICQLEGVDAVDCEALATFQRDGKSWLLLADVGDNRRRRTSCQLYLCEEPATDQRVIAPRRIDFRYPDGAHDCESVGVDPHSNLVLLTTKTLGLVSQVYQLPIPATTATTGAKEPIAEWIATIEVPMAVAMDIAPDGSRAVVLTYGDAYEFVRGTGESWQQAFARSPQRIGMPWRRQGETICYGGDGRSLYLTSERCPTPLWEVPWIDNRGARPLSASPPSGSPQAGGR